MRLYMVFANILKIMSHDIPVVKPNGRNICNCFIFPLV